MQGVDGQFMALRCSCFVKHLTPVEENGDIKGGSWILLIIISTTTPS